MAAVLFFETSAMVQQQLPGFVAECAEVYTCQPGFAIGATFDLLAGHPMGRS